GSPACRFARVGSGGSRSPEEPHPIPPVAAPTARPSWAILGALAGASAAPASVDPRAPGRSLTGQGAPHDAWTARAEAPRGAGRVGEGYVLPSRKQHGHVAAPW